MAMPARNPPPPEVIDEDDFSLSAAHLFGNMSIDQAIDRYELMRTDRAER